MASISEGDVIYVVDSDARVHEFIHHIAKRLNLTLLRFSSGSAFLADYRDQPGCVLVDLCAATPQGHDVLEALGERGFEAAVIAVVNQCPARAIVGALRQGAVNVLDKPLVEEEVLGAIREALEADAARRERRRQMCEVRQRFESLTPNERQVMEMIVAGAANKLIASRLGASLRTIESRRQNVFAKLQVKTVAELVTTVLAYCGQMEQAS